MENEEEEEKKVSWSKLKFLAGEHVSKAVTRAALSSTPIYMKIPSPL